VDGEIVDGEASINESVLTGESKPIEKNTRDKVYAGTLVADNAIQVSVTKLPSGSRLAEITRLVEQTLSEKPPIQRLADRASKYFAYGILIVALLTGVGWMAAGAPVSSAILHAVAVLVVACPCALGLATPLALTITLGKTSKEGILIRNPTALETSGKIDRMIFDKTGTLTQGKMNVNHVELSSFCEMDEKEFLCVIASVEQYSEHSIAKTITNICKDELQKAHNFQVERGKGVSAHVMGKLHAVVKVGSQQFFGKQEQSDLHQKALYYSKKGDVVVWVGWNHQIQGFIALGDAVNQQAKSIVQALQEMGIVITVLSGDSQETTQVISEEIGIKEFEGSCLPEQKAEYIKKWQEKNQIVAMVGDGVNDAPALAQSDLSITVAGGTDVAGETSDVVLMRSDLTLVPWLIRTSRRTRRIILENLGWAFAYNLISIPLASFGLISPVIAAVAMASSSLLVVGNSLRLRK
jgi:Cu+-exporting ATPase